MSQVCVVPVPDELLGERAAALVVSSDPGLSLESVTGFLGDSGVPKAKWPEYVFVVPDLPQNRVGKLNRGEATTHRAGSAAPSSNRRLPEEPLRTARHLAHQP